MQFGRLGTSPSVPILSFLGIEATFLAFFAATVLAAAPQAAFKRSAIVVLLASLTYAMEKTIVPLCTTRPHWAATAASLLWVQFLSASEILLVYNAQLPRLGRSIIARVRSAAGLLWNMRRIGTQWQVKNVPSVQGLDKQSRAEFIVRRLGVTIAAYLFVDIIVSLPPPDPAMVHADKGALFPSRGLSMEDLVFRVIMTASYWLTTGILNLFMVSMGATLAVMAGVSRPSDCPPLYGSFADAYTIRRFWGISWHQMFRAFLTGHANLLADHALPVSRHSTLSRYVRQTTAFFISGLIHYHADQLMGVPDAENGALVFFLLHSTAIMLEDTVRPLLSGIFHRRLSRFLGYAWVAAFFVWSTPVYMYPGNRLGIDPAALLPVRVFGPYIAKRL